ncbi:MAG: hypothetical protein GY820_21940, partial [Gammaproteobacteria bacterium]|nr:hypothetical protein [Gammaproteobacteria bacterium]
MTNKPVMCDELNEMRATLSELRTRQQQNEVTNSVLPMLKTVLQSFTLAQGNQIVYTELAKTPLFQGDGVFRIDPWLDEVVSVLKQCS